MLESLKTPEAVAQRCSVKRVFLEISQNSEENPHARAYGPATLLKKESNIGVFQ